MTSRFNFTGTPALPKEASKRQFVKEGATKDGRKSLSMTFGVKESTNNMGFVEAFDTIQDEIKTMDKDKNKITVKWGARLDPDVVKDVASFRKYTVNLGEDHGGRQEFITQYDMIEFLQKHLPGYKGKVLVTGQFSKEWYKVQSRYTDRFRVQSVFAVADDEKNGLLLTMDIYYNKDSVDKADFKTDQRIILNGYIEQYINSTEKNKYIPQQFVFSSAAYSPDNEKHVRQLAYKLRHVDVTSKTMLHMLWEVILLRGAEEVEWSEAMLSDEQREQIELGFKTAEDFKPQSKIIGDKLFEYRLKLPVMKGDFAEGLVNTDMKMSEFEEMIYVPAMSAGTLEEESGKKKPAEKKDNPPFDEDVSDDDMF